MKMRLKYTRNLRTTMKFFLNRLLIYHQTLDINIYSKNSTVQILKIFTYAQKKKKKILLNAIKQTRKTNETIFIKWLSISWACLSLSVLFLTVIWWRLNMAKKHYGMQSQLEYSDYRCQGNDPCIPCLTPHSAPLFHAPWAGNLWGRLKGLIGRFPVSESNPYLLEIAFGFGNSLHLKCYSPKHTHLMSPILVALETKGCILNLLTLFNNNH